MTIKEIKLFTQETCGACELMKGITLPAIAARYKINPEIIDISKATPEDLDLAKGGMPLLQITFTGTNDIAFWNGFTPLEKIITDIEG